MPGCHCRSHTGRNNEDNNIHHYRLHALCCLEFMTNREYMINLLLDGLESRLNRVSIDDGGASEEAMIYYNINCPYYAGDKRAYCRKEGSLVSSREVCVDCKAHWLEQEVDE